MKRRFEFARVTVAGGPTVEVCVDPQAGDPVVPWLLDHDWIDEPVMRAFQELVQPGARVLDLGCHLGLFSLPAVAMGAEVIAVDANAQHVGLLREAARRGGLKQLSVVHAAVSDSEGEVEFIERNIHGHIATEDGDSQAVRVPAVTVDELVAQHGWDSADVIKLDIEGCELGALNGMRSLHATGARPAMVFECNATMLPLYGGSICGLRGLVRKLGYELLLIDHLRPGTLVECPSELSIQPESACDYLAVVELPTGLSERWTVESRFTLEQSVTRLLDTASSEEEGYRRYAAELVAEGPGWLRQHPLVPPAHRALERDPRPAVRARLEAGVDPRPAAEHAAEPTPPEEGPPADVEILATDVALRRRTGVLEQARDPGPEDLVLSGLSAHVRAGQLLAVVADDPAASVSLLRAFAGLEAPVFGELDAGVDATLIVDAESGFEPDLGVAENIVVFAAFLGCHVPEVSERVMEIAARAGVRRLLRQTLSEVGDGVASRIALTVALECADPNLLLVGPLPAVDDSGFQRWLTTRVAELRAEGGAVVQVIEEPGDLLGSPERALEIAEGHVIACGLPEAIFEDAFAEPAPVAWLQ